MSQLLRFTGSVKRDPSIELWMRDHTGELGSIAPRWFEVMRTCGDDVRELLHSARRYWQGPAGSPPGAGS